MSQVLTNALKRKRNVCFACLYLFIYIFFVTTKNGDLIELWCTTSSSHPISSRKIQFIIRALRQSWFLIDLLFITMIPWRRIMLSIDTRIFNCVWMFVHRPVPFISLTLCEYLPKIAREQWTRKSSLNAHKASFIAS